MSRLSLSGLLLGGLLWAASAPAGGLPHLEWSGAHLAAIDPGSGRVLWSLEGPAVLFRPVTAGDQVFVSSRSGRLLALDARSGARRWVFRSGDDWIYPPVVSGGVLLVVARQSGLYGLDAADGRVLWHRTLPQEPTEAPLALAGRGAALALFDGRLLAVDPRGRTLWQTRLARPALNLSSDGRRLYAGGYDRRLRAFSVEDGRLLWATGLRERLVLPVVRYHGLGIAVTGRPALLAFEPASGHVLGEIRLQADVAALRRDGDRLQLRLRRRNKAVDYRVSLSAGRTNDSRAGSAPVRFSVVPAKEKLP